MLTLVPLAAWEVADMSHNEKTEDFQLNLPF